MNKVLTLLVFVMCFRANGQDVLWAAEVIEFSSEVEDTYLFSAYRAAQVLGKPSILPSESARSKCAWMPKYNRQTEFITVGFQKGLQIKQLAIFQNYNPVMLSSITLIEGNGNQHEISQKDMEKVIIDNGVCRFFIPITSFEVKYVKVSFKNKAKTQVDAIAISSTDIPVKAIVNELPNTGEVELEMLSSNINSDKYSELAPALTADGKNMYLVRVSKKKRGNKKQNIWYSTKQQNGEWSKAVKLGEPLNDEDDNAVIAITRDGSEVYVLNRYNKSGENSQGLSKSTFLNGSYSYPKPVIIEDFHAYAHEVISSDRLVLAIHCEFSATNDQTIIVMGLKRKINYGGKDIYVSFMREDSTYTKPLNLGNTINTAELEGSPFLANDKRTLYFFSKGHLGYGNGDLFMSKRLDDTWTNWSEPINLGRSINSANWDGYISVTKSGTAYLSTEKDFKGDANIYKCTLPESLR